MLGREITEAINEYKRRHPEFDEIMKRFHLSQELYEKALNIMNPGVRKPGPSYTLTTEGRYNVNVSKTT
ncbi:MAG: hypothetical protein V1897_17820 [Pseudomonadota bacterium]